MQDGGLIMDEERRFSTVELFASWAREDFNLWHQAIGTSVTHLSRGDGHITDVTQDAGAVTVHIHYAHGERAHPLWEFRTEVTHMTLPVGLLRDDLLATVTARRLVQERSKQATREARRARSAARPARQPETVA
jgi:hypothetical protein